MPLPPTPLLPLRKEAQCCAGQPWRCSQAARRHAALLPSSLLRPLLLASFAEASPPGGRGSAAAPLLQLVPLLRVLLMLLPARQGLKPFWPMGFLTAGGSCRAHHRWAASSTCMARGREMGRHE